MLKYVHDVAKVVIKDPTFVNAMGARGIDFDYRPGEQLRTEFWREYQLHTDILRRIGMLTR